jgi:invasion protein IalB
VEQDEIDVNLFLANPKAAAAIQQSLAAQHPDYCLICDKDINSSTVCILSQSSSLKV